MLTQPVWPLARPNLTTLGEVGLNSTDLGQHLPIGQKRSNSDKSSQFSPQVAVNARGSRHVSGHAHAHKMGTNVSRQGFAGTTSFQCHQGLDRCAGFPRHPPKARPSPTKCSQTLPLHCLPKYDDMGELELSPRQSSRVYDRRTNFDQIQASFDRIWPSSTMLNTIWLVSTNFGPFL